jgi:glycosyltransferase involved in cell wall biosynthesis
MSRTTSPLLRILGKLAEPFRRARLCDAVQAIEGDVGSYYVSAAVIVKNEARYIREWIEFHRIMGVEHFFIYDNGSTDNLRELLEPYIQNKLITYHFCPGTRLQFPVYNDAAVRYANNTRWLAFIDADEFIVVHGQKITEFLKDFEDCSAVGVNWIMFDSDGKEKMPQSGFVISNYFRSLKDIDHPCNLHIKTIVDPRQVKFISNPHYIKLKGGRYVDENGQEIRSAFTQKNSTKQIQINHYYSKSVEEYMEKIARGCADGTAARQLDQEDYDYTIEGARHYDSGIGDIALKLKEIIPETYNGK